MCEVSSSKLSYFWRYDPDKNSRKKNVQRAMTSEILKIEQWFLYTAHLLNEIYPLVKFEVDISNTFGDMLRTKMWDGRMDGRKDGQRR